MFARRNLRYPIFDLFDRPDANASCPRRNRSTTAPQSLFLLNSGFSLQTAREFAGNGLAQTAHPSEIVKWVFPRALGRDPGDGDKQRALRFLEQQATLVRQENRPEERLALPHPVPVSMEPYLAAAHTDLSLAIFNLNEFIYVD